MHDVFYGFFPLLTLQFINVDDKDDGDRGILSFFDDDGEKTEEMEPNGSTSQEGNPAASLCLTPLLPLGCSCHKSFILFSQMTTKRKAPDRGDSANSAWRTSLPWSSSSSTCCWQRWLRSWPTRPSQMFWRSWKTLLCLSPTRKWTSFHAQVCQESTT